MTVLAAVLGAVLLAGGCQRSVEPGPGPRTDDACEAGDARPRCYDADDVQLFCYLVDLRLAFEDAGLAARDLPAWADPETSQGAPRMYDLAGQVPASVGAVMDRFDLWRSQTGVRSVDRQATSACADDTTHEDVVAIYGEPSADPSG